MRTAYRIARLLFGAGILLSLLRAFDVRLALGLALALVVLVAAGRAFPRWPAGSLLRDPLPGWGTAAIGAAVFVLVWVARFAYPGVSYSNELWWRFALRAGDAPRALRALVGASVMLALFGLARILVRRLPPRRPTVAGRRDAPPSAEQPPPPPRASGFSGD